MGRGAYILCTLAAALSTGAAAQTLGDPAYGEYLSAECTTCHLAAGTSNGIPAITHWPAADFVTALQGYKSKTRPGPIMQMIAGRLSDDEIAALAAYYESIEN
jgi:cytochrome c